MDSSNDPLGSKAEALWADLVAVSQAPVELSEIVDLFAVVTRGAGSAEVAHRLGPAHVVVQLAAVVVAGRYALDPDTSALTVVVGAYLAEPALSERWFGYGLTEPEDSMFASLARQAFALDVAAFLDREGDP